MIKQNSTEKGQALVIVVLALIVLLGFTALAIDGGMTYSDRRFAQNGADAASLAGAGAAAGYLKYAAESGSPSLMNGVSGENWECDSAGVQEAMNKAREMASLVGSNNHFIIASTAGIPADGLVNIYCEDQTGHYIDVGVTLTMNTTTSFVHFVYGGPVRNTVNAVTRVFPQEPVFAGYSIISLDDNCAGNSKGMSFDGNYAVNINGGGTFSYSCLIQNGVTGYVNVINGSINYDQNFPFDPNGSDTTFNPPEAVQPVDDTQFPKPSIPSPANYCHGPVNPPPVDNGTSLTYVSGTYSGNNNGISVHNGSKPVILETGLYCFEDSASLSVTGNNVTGENVTLYFAANSGGFDTVGTNVNNQFSVDLTAPDPPCVEPLGDNCLPAVPHLLIYIEPCPPLPAPCTNPGVKLGGDSGSRYEGTIYAPDGQVDVGGNASTLSQVGVQIIGNTVKVHGDVEININYDGSKVYHTPNVMNLEK